MSGSKPGSRGAGRRSDFLLGRVVSFLLSGRRGWLWVMSHGWHLENTDWFTYLGGRSHWTTPA